MTSDPTRRAVVSWWDLDGPDSSGTHLTVAWLDDDNREQAYTFRGSHAYWMAQVFKARDSRIAGLEADLAHLRAHIRRIWEALGQDEPWSAVNALEKLATFASQELSAGYDGHGWEEVHAAVEAAGRHVENLRRALAPHDR